MDEEMIRTLALQINHRSRQMHVAVNVNVNQCQSEIFNVARIAELSPLANSSAVVPYAVSHAGERSAKLASLYTATLDIAGSMTKIRNYSAYDYLIWSLLLRSASVVTCSHDRRKYDLHQHQLICSGELIRV